MQKKDVTPITRFVTFSIVAVGAAPLTSEFPLAQVSINQLFMIIGYLAPSARQWPLMFV